MSKAGSFLATVLAVLGFGLVAASEGYCQAGVSSAMSEVKKTVDEVVKVNTAYPGEVNVNPRRAKLREVIQPRFDFAEMSKRSLGAFWQEITPQEQQDFVNVFSDLLAQTYLARIENCTADTVKFETENVDFPRAVVKTTVMNKGDKFPIDYKLMNTNGTWRVYDVVIENIGLVANYRNEFAGIIRKDKFSGLMQKLREKVNR